MQIRGGSNGLARSTTTAADGTYVLLTVPPSTYDVQVELDGFAPVIREAQTLHVGATVDMNFVLSVAGVAEHVTVVASGPLLETSKNTLTRIVQTQELDGLPVVARNFNDLADLAPGVTKSGPYGGVSISGSLDFQNAYQVDGVSAERHHLGDLRVPYAQDWIQEFQVMTSQYNAEFGGAAGGVLNAVTRSGGNQVRGRAYGFFRDDAWDAAPALAARTTPLSEQRAGATLGGPIVKNRIFYFGGMEHLRHRSSSLVASAFPQANGAFPLTDDETLSLAKLDAEGDAHRVRLRYNAQRGRTTGSSVGGTSTWEHGRFARRAADDVVGGWTWIVSSSLLSELRAGWSRTLPRDGCTYATQHPPGTWFERSYPGAQFGCPVNFGTIGEGQLQLVHNVSWTRGSHDVKVGAQTVRTRSSGDFRNFRDGRFSFARDVPFTLDDPNSYPFSFVAIEGPTAWDVAGWSFGAFAQDRWRLRRDLTLNAGVRYDLDGALTALSPLVRTDKGLHPIDADANNIATRIGIAWTPLHDDKRILVRAGVGRYYDQNHNNVASILLLNNVLVDRIVSINANSPLLNPFWPDIAAARRSLAEALAHNRMPDLSALSAVAGSTNDIDRDLQIPATTQASVGIAHDLRSWLTASADLVYARGRDLYVIRNVNLDPITFRRVNQNYSVIHAFGNGGWSRYRALQMQISAAGAQRFVKAGYTLAVNRSNTNATISTGAATNPFDYSEDEGPTDTDVRHALTVNGSTELPLRIQVSGIFRYRSALPYSAISTGPRPDGKPFGYRPEPRNGRRGDSATSLDLRIATHMAIGAGVSVLPFVEMFNIANATNYDGYIGTVTSALFGRPTSAGPMRRIQLGFRVEW